VPSVLISGTVAGGTVVSTPISIDSETQTTITPAADPTKSTVAIICYGDTNADGDVTETESGVTIQIRQTTPPTDDEGHTFDGTTYSYTSDASGAVVLTLWRNATYSWRRGKGSWSSFTPDAATYTVSSIVGADS